MKGLGRVRLEGIVKRHGTVDRAQRSISRSSRASSSRCSGRRARARRRRCALSPVSKPSTGRVLIDDQDVTDASPGERDVAMVFQSYALYPHMTVAENIGFPLRMSGVPSGEIALAVRDAAAQGTHRPSARPHARPAVGRPAAALCAGARDRAQATAVPARRAALEPRRQAAPRNPGRAARRCSARSASPRST